MINIRPRSKAASSTVCACRGFVLLNLFSKCAGTRWTNADIPSIAYGRPPAPRAEASAGLCGSHNRLEVFGPQVRAHELQPIGSLTSRGIFRRRRRRECRTVAAADGTCAWIGRTLRLSRDRMRYSSRRFRRRPFPRSQSRIFVLQAICWSWVPQVRGSHRFTLGEDSNLLVQGGILDSLSGEPPIF